MDVRDPIPIYESPSVTLLEIVVEQGYAQSNPYHIEEQEEIDGGEYDL